MLRMDKEPSSPFVISEPALTVHALSLVSRSRDDLTMNNMDRKTFRGGGGPPIRPKTPKNTGHHKCLMIQEICLDGNLTAACCKLRHSQGVKFQLTRSRSQKPDIGACEKQEGVETTGQLVIARGKAAKLFESVDESPDEVSRLVAMPVGLALGRAPFRDGMMA